MTAAGPVGAEPASIPGEADLVEALRAGAPEAYERFVRAHVSRVKAVAERYLRNEEDANDVVQETFLSAFKAIRCCQVDSWALPSKRRIA